MAERLHAKLGASSAHRWFECPGCIQESEGMPNDETPYAREGSAAHAVAEYCLNNDCDAWSRVDEEIKGYPDIDCDDEMAEAVQLYLDTVRADFNATKDGELDIEKSFDLSHIYKDCFGTNDALIYSPSQKKMTIYDYKHGVGIPVEVENNRQMMTYATGALTGMNNRAIREIELVIVQPRSYHIQGDVRRWSLSPNQLLDFMGDFRVNAGRTEAKNPEYKAGYWCQFCAGAPKCKKIEETALEICHSYKTTDGSFDMPEPSTLSPQQLADSLRKINIVKIWVKSVEAFTLREAQAGKMLPGFKLVPKRATKKWKSEDRLKERMAKMNLADAVLSGKVKSPPQMMAYLKSKGYAADQVEAMVGDLFEAISSGANLVPQEDPRAPLKPDAISEFSL